MWIVTAHHPTGPVVEQFHAEQDALAAQQRHLAQRVPVTLDPVGEGWLYPQQCSFCGRDKEAVEHFCAAPAGKGAAICNRCLMLIGSAFGVVEFPPLSGGWRQSGRVVPPPRSD